MARVVVEGTEFTIGSDRVQDLMQWLQTNGGVKVESAAPVGGEFTGQQLLNEVKPASHTDPPRQKQDPDKTWDFGTKWI